MVNGVAERCLEREVHAPEPVFEFRCGVDSEVVCADKVCKSAGAVGYFGCSGYMRVHGAPIAFESTFEAYGYAFYGEGVCSVLVREEGVLFDVLAYEIVVGRHGEGLRHRLPLVLADECDKVLFFEALYDFEIVADIVVGKRRRLAVCQRACDSETHIIPRDVGFEDVVYEGSLLVQLIDEFSG